MIVFKIRSINQFVMVLQQICDCPLVFPTVDMMLDIYGGCDITYDETIGMATGIYPPGELPE